VKKVVLAYSGGLDTSIILKWLQTTYGCEVVTFTADLGQGEELEPARRKAELLGIKPDNIFVEDLREEFVATTCSRCFGPMPSTRAVSASALDRAAANRQAPDRDRRGGRGRRRLARCDGKGNDQVRFELAYYALKPDVTVIAPWREWDLRSREQLIDFAEKHQIPIAKDKRGDAPSRSTRTCCTPRPRGRCLRTRRRSCRTTFIPARSPREAPDKPTLVTVGFERGDAVSIDGQRLSPATLLAR
jgi:argininosuccinate synthase